MKIIFYLITVFITCYVYDENRYWKGRSDCLDISIQKLLEKRQEE